MPSCTSLTTKGIYFYLTVVTYLLTTTLFVTAILTGSWGSLSDSEGTVSLYSACTSGACVVNSAIRDISVRSTIITVLCLTAVGIIVTIYSKLNKNVCSMLAGVVLFYTAAFSSLVAMAMYMIRPFSSRTWALSAVIGWLGVVGKFYLAFTAHRSLIQHERKYLNGISDYLVFV